ncbi:DNA-directed RNA polymerase subunit beta [Hordeum vulgare]|nr:DNA-directed RNA polymerase subunit beta [Hordeum vulgare]
MLSGVPALIAKFAQCNNHAEQAAQVAQEELLHLERSVGVIDLGLELINPVIEPGEMLPNVIGINLVLVGEICDHHVVGVESMLHHPLALEDLLLHCFEPRLHASGLLGPLIITDVQHPITHLDRLRVLQHSRKDHHNRRVLAHNELFGRLREAEGQLVDLRVRLDQVGPERDALRDEGARLHQEVELL